jgi:phosphate transport system permease protein
MVVLEREEWGSFFGYLVGLKSAGVLLNSRDVWSDFQQMLDRASSLRDEIEALEKGEIGRINYSLERLRLEERGLQLDGAENGRPRN